MFNVESENARLRQECDEQYDDYQARVSKLNSEYISLRDKYNGEISIINNERISMREEIRKLYDFLHLIGGKMGNRITVFDFTMELPAIHEELPMIPKPEKPILENIHILRDQFLSLPINQKNQKKLREFELKLSNCEVEYTNDCDKRIQKNKSIEDAVEIAQIYRNTVIMVRDTIRDKIIPEMDLIRAFLYADAIRQQVLEGGNPQEAQPASIEEYEGTAQDIHFQFVKNTFDFYRISTQFFKEKILTNILENKGITDEEKEAFQTKIEEIQRSKELLESKKVL